MKLFTLTIRRNGIPHSKILSCLIFFFLLFIISCEKDNKTSGAPKHSTLTIEKAKEFFSQTKIKEFDTHDRGGEDEYDTGFYMRLGWNNGSEYHDERYDLDVIEVPILESSLSKKFGSS